MAKFIDDGGPAFPRSIGTDEHESPCNVALPQDGMTLRDYFAAQALSAIIVADGAQYFSKPNLHAQTAYAHADAMLKARGEDQ